MTFPFRFGAAPCCCEYSCFKFEDATFGSPGTTLSSDWDETTGSAHGNWEVLFEIPPGGGFFLHELAGTAKGTDGTADAIVFCTQKVPEHSSGEMHISVDVLERKVGDVYRIYPCCTAVGTLGPVKVEFTVGDADVWTIEIFLDSVSQATSLMTATDDYRVTLHVCADHGNKMVTATISGLLVTGSDIAWGDACDPGSGRYCAIGHDNDGSGAIFDVFVFEELRLPNGVWCYQCWCSCMSVVVPKTLALSFNGYGTATCLNDLDITLEWDGGSVAIPNWTGEVIKSNVVLWDRTLEAWYTASVTISAILNCGLPPVGGWQLGLAFTPDVEDSLHDFDCCQIHSYTCDISIPLDDSTCVPISLHFGTFTLGCYLCYQQAAPPAPGPTFGTFDMWVTL